MYYVDFNLHITDKLGIVVENWPLKLFTAPGSIGSRIELNTLFHAWETGATHFRRLAPAELDAWQRQQAQATVASQQAQAVVASQQAQATVALHQQASTSTSPPLPAGHPSTPVIAETVAPASSAAGTSLLTTTTSPALTMSAATSIFAVGTNVLVTKKPRKVRSDKGKLWGPSKKKLASRAAGDAGAGSGAGPSGSLGAQAST
ncbi:hypothetical protein BC835DRAFT_1425003 [Cytidiella melzeri]|nr:hypothetical protein BC835DRAFT_1425003 [Cytidiella melzeri]